VGIMQWVGMDRKEGIGVLGMVGMDRIVALGFVNLDRIGQIWIGLGARSDWYGWDWNASFGGNGWDWSVIFGGNG